MADLSWFFGIALQEYEEVRSPDDGSFEEKIQEQELIYYQYEKQRDLATMAGADPDDVEIPEKAKEYMVRKTTRFTVIVYRVQSD